jgi:hypothetical protein
VGASARCGCCPECQTATVDPFGVAALLALPILRNLGHRGRARAAREFGAKLAGSTGCVGSALLAIHHSAISFGSRLGESTGCVRMRISVGGALKIIVLSSSESVYETLPSRLEPGDISFLLVE